MGALGNLSIGFSFTATNNLDNGGLFPGVGTGLPVWVGLGKQLKQLGFHSFSFGLVHQFVFFVFVYISILDSPHASNPQRTIR